MPFSNGLGVARRSKKRTEWVSTRRIVAVEASTDLHTIAHYCIRSSFPCYANPPQPTLYSTLFGRLYTRSTIPIFQSPGATTITRSAFFSFVKSAGHRQACRCPLPSSADRKSNRRPPRSRRLWRKWNRPDAVLKLAPLLLRFFPVCLLFCLPLARTPFTVP